jgi:septal ring factor EnvC (AmiA/AmiB activator)
LFGCRRCINKQGIEFNKRSSFFCLFTFPVFFIVIAFHLFIPAYTCAADATNKLTEIQQNYKNKLKEINKAKKKEQSITSRMKDIKGDISKKERNLKSYDKRISRTQAEILKLSEDVELYMKKLDDRRQYLKERVRSLHKRQYGGDAGVLISAKDYQDLIKKSKYLCLMAYYDGRLIKKYSVAIDEINSKKRNMEALEDKLIASKSGTWTDKKQLEAKRKKKGEMLAAVKGKRFSHEKKIKEIQTSSRKLQKMIKGLEAKNIPTSAVGKGFKSLKGRLPWPANGRILVRYGKQHDREIKKTVFRNGIEIAVRSGDRPKAVAGGRVVYTGRLKGYGNLVIIDHGSGYHSLYGNLSRISPKKGDILVKGYNVGKISASKSSGIPALYFEIRYRGKSVDPARWLKRRS